MKSGGASAKQVVESPTTSSHCVAVFYRWIISLVIASLLVGAGCENSGSQAADSAAKKSPAGQPQPKLPMIKLWLGSKELNTEIARTPNQLATGMMFRKEMAETEAMLFLFAQPHKASFYMKNTIVPLSCAYIDSEGVILEIHDMKPLEEKPIEAASDKIQFVLETKQGWFERNKVGVGALVRTEKGSLVETFIVGAWKR